MDKKYYYKAMDKNMKCWRDFYFKVGETYTIDSKELELCSDKVFHFCEKLEDTIEYYDCSTDRHFVIEVLGDIVTKESKSGSNKIRIVREITRDEIEEHIQDKDSYNAKKFLALYTTNIKILEILSKDKEWIVREGIAENPNTHVHILEELSKDEYWRICLAVAKNINTPLYILEELFKENSYSINKAIAKNPNTSIYLLEELANNKYEDVRVGVAENLNTPTHILEKLAEDEELNVFLAVFWNPNVPVYLIEEQSKSQNDYIRDIIAHNPYTPVYILENLAKDEIQHVREQAQKRLKEITQ